MRAAARAGSVPGRAAAGGAGRTPRQRLLAAAGVLGAILAAALFHVWSRLAVVRLGYRLEAAREAHAERLEENRRLRLELATLTAPARLAAAARDRLGLVSPTPDRIVHLAPSGGRPAEAPGRAATGRRRPGVLSGVDSAPASDR